MTETRGWDAYWKGSSSGVAFGLEGVDHPILAEYWNRFFKGLRTKMLTWSVAFMLLSCGGSWVRAMVIVWDSKLTEVASICARAKADSKRNAVIRVILM